MLTDHPQNVEELRVQEGLPLGNPAGKAVAEVYGLPIVLIRQRKLQFDVLDVPEKPPGNGKGIHVVRTENAAAVADGADGQLGQRPAAGEPLPKKNAVTVRRRRGSAFCGGLTPPTRNSAIVKV